MKQYWCIILVVSLLLASSANNALADDVLRVIVTDSQGNRIGGVTIRGCIKIDDVNICFFEEYTGKDGVAEIMYEEGVEVYIFAEKRGWNAVSYPNKDPIEIPDPVNLWKNDEVHIRLVKKTSAQLY